MKRPRFFGACSSHTASWTSCAGCSVRALGRPSPFYADTAYASTTPHRITSPKLGVTRCSNSDPGNHHNELFAITGPVARANAAVAISVWRLPARPRPHSPTLRSVLRGAAACAERVCLSPTAFSLSYPVGEVLSGDEDEIGRAHV